MDYSFMYSIKVIIIIIIMIMSKLSGIYFFYVITYCYVLWWDWKTKSWWNCVMIWIDCEALFNLWLTFSLLVPILWGTSIFSFDRRFLKFCISKLNFCVKIPIYYTIVLSWKILSNNKKTHNIIKFDDNDNN